MIMNDTFTAIAAINLEPIKFKLMHQKCGEGWSQTRTDAVATEYRRYLYLQHANPDQLSSPTKDVDTFWHYHILDTVKYAEDCAKAFGYFMHHYPYVGLLEGDDEDVGEKAAERTRELYEATFGEPYNRVEAYGDQMPAQTRNPQSMVARCQPCGTFKPAAKEADAAGCRTLIIAKPTAVPATPASCH